MKTLFVMRHGKARRDIPEQSDFERPLTSYGLTAAPFMGRMIYENNLQPNLIVSSPAKRAKQTAILVKETAGIETKIQYSEKLYEASPATLLSVVSDIQCQHKSALLIGHNPGIEGFIRILTNETQRMATSSIAKIVLNINQWSEISQDCGFLELLMRPRDLMERVEI